MMFCAAAITIEILDNVKDNKWHFKNEFKSAIQNVGEHVLLLWSIELLEHIESVTDLSGQRIGSVSYTHLDKHANLKYKFGNRHFWAEGYYVSTVGLNESTIKKYIQDQEKADIALDKLSVKEYKDPFSN